MRFFSKNWALLIWTLNPMHNKILRANGLISMYLPLRVGPKNAKLKIMRDTRGEESVNILNMTFTHKEKTGSTCYMFILNTACFGSNPFIALKMQKLET